MSNFSNKPIHVIGGGLSGSEAAWQIAEAGIPVVLHEMRPVKQTPAHKTAGLAELVCSNSLRSDDAATNAVGLLHAEMRLAHSLVMKVADDHQVPAGSALAVDRDIFSRTITEKIENHPLIDIDRGELATLPPEEWGNVIIATGPLTSPRLAEAISTVTGADALSFYDAIAPIVYKDTIDMDICWYQSRYDKVGPGGTGKDYINCPLDKEQYENFVKALMEGEKAEFHDFEKVPYFDGCLPIEVMAERGSETLRHGPMKPMGLTNAHNPTVKAYAIVQLRQDNALGTLYNMVGFQTKLKYGEQTRIFRSIPGLENAEFARLGGIHRNTYLNSPVLLDETLRLKKLERLRFAGQMTGCEGYVESAAMGLVAGRFAIADYNGVKPKLPPVTTAFGALLNHITRGHLPTEDTGKQSFQPMNINFGLFPPVEVEKQDGIRLRGKEKILAKKRALTARALADCKTWLNEGKIQ
ncbi:MULTISPECIES: methylenetetrahydrofolate--tRNA-(uracil(54)-C(5))-methyltransferase (FADH(2)-oxidizing) TrmFO [Bartonella]|uniref:Methylenetetrahydrofolate--tRNA-(uracil-5-)-methyltransferase TrmFO n=1 Tax=Bartonella choladocola TaxID=2750995 RepID=A0A1U9MGL7_9HYPH|nr:MULTISPECIES: methylenetetrahydrofolate--tRNA-(uracil(54)-C(5))-methyltransferase (FADH(2)-oxidizing) TrmFO [Bartonella]AQT47075.1 methylenetetrahydrofolate--tRNA-(uracil-5-)-methyltransferase [Bartonella choladocola]MBH9975244.1 methylenetetrahydrofolate--tRNA-(uracil(54)-C(5))-methyltransferase (FADH(2)-oxidizing) TrmFO [Bartonella choladocola]MBI0014851.1 methylenetetrahydrofolate--tRNA-(uracil(54)-C(5))-methyltransferase (FADH(2)-oxidizing) TrmFO [Bartonella sp. B10834G3]MBI0140427.1 met